MATNNKNFRVKNGLDVNGEINASAVGGDEGGQINLQKPATGTTLSGNVSIDVYQNKIRIFDSGGTARGAYIDLSAAGEGVSSNLLAGGGGGISNVVEDTTPQLGGDLDTNGYDITNLNALTLDTTPAGVPGSQGTLAWNPDQETLDIQLDTNVVLPVGQQHVIRVKNSSGSVAIPKGTVVSFAGATGDTVKVTPSISTSAYEPHTLVGVTSEEIAADGFGFVTQYGFVRGINTNSWTLGNLLYIDPTTPGALTNSAPTAPNWTFPIAAVTRVNSSSGIILVRTIPGGHLHDIVDVAIDGTPADNELLAYNSNTATWINQTAEEAGVANLSGATFTGNVAGTHISSSNSISSYVLRASSNSLDTNLLSSTTHGLQIGGTGGSHIRITNSEIQSVSGGVGYGLDINQYGGGVNFGINGVVPMTLNGTITIENKQGPTKVPFAIFANATQSANVSEWLASGGSSMLASISNVGTFTARNIVSTVATGTAPFSVSSTTQVTNLTAQFANTAFSVAISNVTSMGTNVSTFLTTPNSINFLNTITDETGTGNVVFSTSPVLTTPNIGAAIGTSVNVTGQLISTVATGTAPLAVTSTTKVTNLNADLLDGYNTSTNADANTVSVRDTNGSIKANVFYGDVLGSSITVGDNISANTINTTALANVAQLTVGSTATFNKPQGSAPFIVVSTTQVTNLTAQFVTNGVYTTTTSLPNVTSVNSTTIPNSATLLTTTTTSLPNVTSINSTTIPNSATLLTTGNIGSTVQAYDNDIASLANTINAVGFLYNNGAGTFSYTSIPNGATTALSANGASTIVARDANGSFAGNVITATRFIGIIDGGSA